MVINITSGHSTNSANTKWQTTTNRTVNWSPVVQKHILTIPNTTVDIGPNLCDCCYYFFPKSARLQCV